MSAARLRAIEVDCPVCERPAGKRCRNRITGRRKPKGEEHVIRRMRANRLTNIAALARLGIHINEPDGFHVIERADLDDPPQALLGIARETTMGTLRPPATPTKFIPIRSTDERLTPQGNDDAID